MIQVSTCLLLVLCGHFQSQLNSYWEGKLAVHKTDQHKENDIKWQKSVRGTKQVLIRCQHVEGEKAEWLIVIGGWFHGLHLAVNGRKIPQNVVYFSHRVRILWEEGVTADTGPASHGIRGWSVTLLFFSISLDLCMQAGGQLHAGIGRGNFFFFSPSHPPYPTPLGGHKAPSWSPCAMRLLPTSYLFYIW